MSKKMHAILYSVLGLCVAAAVVFGVMRSAKANQYRGKLTGVYDSALYSAMDALQSAQYKLEKALLSDTGKQQAQLLAAVSGDARTISAGLSVMPLSHSAIRDTTKFANQLSDFSASLIRPEETPMTAEERESVQGMIDISAALYEALSNAQSAAKTAADDENTYWLSADESVRPVERVGGENKIEYPTLIYDGPFSDARETGSPKALSGQVISRETAQETARAFVGEGRITGVVQGTDSGGVMPAYGVTVRTNDVTLEVAVTKTGGKVLWMSPDNAGFASEKSVEECREAALVFLSRNGYPDMQPTYFQVYNGLATLNFAATQGDCLLYPDLIKVQVRMDSAQVVGFEANHYLMNHQARSGLTPRLSAEEAAGSVSELLKVSDTRLCLIPTDGGETLAYEFRGEYRDHIYLVYINANTGEQTDILKLVEDGNGLLAA